MEINEEHIRKHLQVLTSRWTELDTEAYFEIRCIKERENDTLNKRQKYTPDQIDSAVEFATKYNKDDYNAYVTVNPSKTKNGATKDDDVIASFFCFCDCDTVESVDILGKFLKNEKLHSFAVYTGMQPKRGHVYFGIDKPLYDMDAWRELQRGVAQKLHSDISVCNPSRILRLAGTLNIPTATKLKKGRIREETVLRVYGNNSQTLNTLTTKFPYEYAKPFRLELGSNKQRLDITDTINRIKAGDNWHTNMISAVASLVSRGMSDMEIQAMLQDITLAGYSSAQTHDEVQVAINTARNKGFGDNATIIHDRNIPRKVALSSTSDEKNFPSLPFQRWKKLNPLSLPPTIFVYGRHYIKKFFSVTASPGGIGKSALSLVEAVSMASGVSLLGEYVEKSNVAYYNAEDPLDQILKRVYAIQQHYKLTDEQLYDLHILSGRDAPIDIMIGDSGVINRLDYDRLEHAIDKHKLDVVILDPLANIHTASETVENFAKIGREFSMLADKHNCAIELVHHTRKLQKAMEVSIDDARGGGSLIAAARSARILNRCTKEEGESLGVEHIDYFKIESGTKNNLARPLEKIQWYKKTSYHIAEIGDKGEEIVVVEKYIPPATFEGFSDDKIHKLYDAIKNTHYYLYESANATTTDTKMSIHSFIAEKIELDITDKANLFKVKKMINTWLEQGVLKKKKIDKSKTDPASRKTGVVNIVVAGDVVPAVAL